MAQLIQLGLRFRALFALFFDTRCLMDRFTAGRDALIRKIAISSLQNLLLYHVSLRRRRLVVVALA